MEYNMEKYKKFTSKKAKKRLPRLALGILTPILCLILILVCWVAGDLIINMQIEAAPRRVSDPSLYDGTELLQMVWLYGNKGQTNETFSLKMEDITAERVFNALPGYIRYLEERLDCADFRAVFLLKLLFDGGEDLDALSPLIRQKIGAALTGFKFWITSPGADSMCYYSENHQINFAVIEYLTGQAFPDAVFAVDGKTGAEHVRIAAKRIEDWLDMRFLYGFSECFSANYYVVDIAALTMLLAYGNRADGILMERAKMALDLIFADFALQMYDYTFVSPSGRAYQYNNLCWETSDAARIVDHVWNLNRIQDNRFNYYLITSVVNNNLDLLASGSTPYYKIPEVILELGRSNEKIVRTSTGLNLSDLDAHGLLGQSDRQMMFQLGMGALSNPEIIENTLDYINKYNLLTNQFLTNFKYFNIKAIRYSGLMPVMSKWVNPYINGFANQEYNVYTYIKNSYKLSTNQAYFPGSFGSQQLQSVALLPGGIPIYTTHPVDTMTGTPGYWAGYGVAPHAVQEQNIALLMYKLPKNIALLSDKPLPYTHTYFPEAEFDEVMIDGSRAFARRGDTYIALLGSGTLRYADRDEARLEGLPYKTAGRFDLIQEGKEQAWVYELSDASEGSFSDFIQRIRGNTLRFDGDSVRYISNAKTYSVEYKGSFAINGQTIRTDYARYESDFVHAAKYQTTFEYAFHGKSLVLDYPNAKRTVRD